MNNLITVTVMTSLDGNHIFWGILLILPDPVIMIVFHASAFTCVKVCSMVQLL